MEFNDVINERYSVRGYLDKEVEKENRQLRSDKKEKSLEGFLKFFMYYHKLVLHFVKSIFCICWDHYIVFIELSVILLPAIILPYGVP